MAGLGLAQIAELALTYVELPDLVQRTVTVPVSVNVVPADEAARRMPAIGVRREKLFLQVQRAKRATVDALRDGDVTRARAILADAGELLVTAPGALQDQAVADEVRWLGRVRDRLSLEDQVRNLKRLRSDADRKARGYTSRTWGGEVSSQACDGADAPGSDGHRDSGHGGGEAEPPEVA